MEPEQQMAGHNVLNLLVVCTVVGGFLWVRSASGGRVWVNTAHAHSN